MKSIIPIVGLALICSGCNRQGGSSQGSSAQGDAGQSIKEQKRQIDSAAKEAENQVKADASAQRKRIEAEADAAKAQIEAQKAKADAQIKTEQKNHEAQSAQIQEAVGTAQKSITGQQQDDTQLLQKAQAQVQDNPGVDVTVQNGTVSLNGLVDSEQQKTNLQQKVKSIPGVQDVQNNLKVKTSPQNNQ